jgi:siroheme synthase
VGEGDAPSDWAAPLAQADTAVIYMGAGEAEALAAILLAQGRPASLPVVAVENASLAGSRTIATSLGALSALATEAFAGPVVLLLGEVFAAGVEADRVRRNFLATSAAYLSETAGRRVAAR